MNIACMPSKNIIHTAKVASLIGRHQEFGIETGPIVVNMAGVSARKRKMVDLGKCSIHRTAYSPGRVMRRRRTDTYR
jgi:pyruvate/2-oxoglutarate dehydrogenase complex dihydrolipoamide dehydrogenase (E3) component